ncbi:hypothetical protein EVAR_53343_1 [Eumeta japonica]|uniref:Uncharacterized protein n=1 Tax=Eumeta variegata TaxID=151549 RepID=A0A4C1XA33_EUMVA|nr:hypothetical protein EVAR_53343_1 [Eumeta japonica]
MDKGGRGAIVLLPPSPPHTHTHTASPTVTTSERLLCGRTTKWFAGLNFHGIRLYRQLLRFTLPEISLIPLARCRQTRRPLIERLTSPGRPSSVRS